MWGYIASNRIREMNEVMDLVAMRGGILDWRRAQSIVTALDEARARFERRCRNASAVASFLSAHARVSEVHHPSLPGHPDADVLATCYSLPGSLLSFRLDGADEEKTRHFCDVLAMTRVPRYALSFDGLVTKVNPIDRCRSTGPPRTRHGHWVSTNSFDWA
jgi:cystathionine beta-lyase/cystathionine gamma-synthase